MTTTKQFYKVWFTNGRDRTAQIICDTERFPIGNTSLATYSLLFPYFEANKMHRLCITSPFNSFEEAFHERSRAMDLLLPEADRFFQSTR